MDTVQLVVGNTHLPFAFGGIFRCLKPGDQTGFVPGCNKVWVTIPVYVYDFTVDEFMALGVVNNVLLPVRGDKEPGFLVTVTDDIDFTVTSEVCRDGHICTKPLVDDMLLPGFCPK